MTGILLDEKGVRCYEKGEMTFEMVKIKQDRLVKPAGVEYMCFKCKIVATINEQGDYECSCTGTDGKAVSLDHETGCSPPYGWGRVKYVIIEVET